MKSFRNSEKHQKQSIKFQSFKKFEKFPKKTMHRTIWNLLENTKTLERDLQNILENPEEFYIAF